MDQLAWIAEELLQCERDGLLRRLATYDGSSSCLTTPAGQQLINFASNDYLLLAQDPRLANAVCAAVQQHTWGSGSSPLITGHTTCHMNLERDLSQFEQTEAALVFSSGYAANIGTITSLASRGDVIFSDEKNHASIIDGCRLSGARIQVYRHLDVAFLEKMIMQTSGFRRRLIVTDTLFSMDGDLAPLQQLVKIAEQYDAMLMIDEAHATGVFGEHGRGVAEHLGVESDIPVKVGTMSKALGCAGGFVAGSQQLVDWLVNRARPYIFSTAQAAAGMAAATVALAIVQQEPKRRRKLLDRADTVRCELRRQGWTIQSESQIIPVLTGDPESALQMSAFLREQGLLVPAVRPPSVPDGESLLRISLSYGHVDSMIEQLLEAFAKLAGQQGKCSK